MVDVSEGTILTLKSAVDFGQMKVIFHFDQDVHYLRFFLLIAGITGSLIDSVVFFLEGTFVLPGDFEFTEAGGRGASVNLVNDSVQYSFHYIISHPIPCYTYHKNLSVVRGV